MYSFAYTANCPKPHVTRRVIYVLQVVRSRAVPAAAKGGTVLMLVPLLDMQVYMADRPRSREWQCTVA